jgi:hypothetical protein
VTPSSRKPDDERKQDAGSATPEQARPPQRLPAPRHEQLAENQKRARKRRPKFVL